MKLKLLREAAADFYKVTLDEINAVHRDASIIKVRHICQWTACEAAGYTKSAVAQFWGCDRGSVYYGCRMINKRIKTSEEEKQQLQSFLTFAEKYIAERMAK